MAPNENQLRDSLSWPNKPFLSFFRCSAAGMQDTAVSTAGGVGGSGCRDTRKVSVERGAGGTFRGVGVAGQLNIFFLTGLLWWPADSSICSRQDWGGKWSVFKA